MASGARPRRRRSTSSTTASSTATASSRASASTAGEPFLLDAHLARLEASARALALELPLDRAALADLCREGARRSATDDGYLRLVVTRGRGALGVSPHTCGAPSVILIAAPLALYPEEARLRRRAHRHLGPAPLRARRAAAAGQEPQLPHQRAGLDRGAPPGRRGGDPAERAGPHRGVHGRQPLRRARRTRPHARDRRTAPSTASRARSSSTCSPASASRPRPAPLVPVDAWTADEIFLTGTGAEIVRVREIDGRPVGERGRPGHRAGRAGLRGLRRGALLGRALDPHPGARRAVAEARVEGADRRVALLVERLQAGVAVADGPAQLRALEGAGDAAARATSGARP